jgi:hypothetical protein
MATDSTVELSADFLGGRMMVYSLATREPVKGVLSAYKTSGRPPNNHFQVRSRAPQFFIRT